MHVMQTVILVKIKPCYQDIVKEKSRIVIAQPLFFFFFKFFLWSLFIYLLIFSFISET